MITSRMIKDYAMECGADAVGIAPMERFEGAPKDMDARYFYPAAKSMIGFIFRIPRGYIRGIEEGTQFYQYPSLGYAAINEDFAPEVIYETGKFIEDHGFEAAVFRNTGGRGPVSDMDGKPGFMASPEEYKRVCGYSHPVKDGYPGPDMLFQFRIAAYLCGLGEIGYSKMFLTPQFGPMTRQAFIFTDAELEPDPLYEGEPLCDKCMACAAACPGKCIDRKETVKVRLAGKDVEWGKLHEWDCFAYYQGANKKSNPFIEPDIFDGIDGGEKIIRGEKHIDPVEFTEIQKRLSSSYPGGLYGYNPPKCGGCQRACLVSMERKGRLKNKFKNSFRAAKPWNLNIKNRTQEN